jgi:hypothetical protein
MKADDNKLIEKPYTSIRKSSTKIRKRIKRRKG